MRGPSSMFRLGFAVALATIGLIAVGCASGTGPPPPPAGTERGACRADDACDVGLECWSARCVRPPGAACGEVARRLSSYRVGNYATPEEVAAAAADIAAVCQAQQLTMREGRCLLDARGEDELLACPRVVLPELVAKVEARRAPPPEPDPEIDASGPSVFPSDPWASSGPSHGPCDRYAAVLVAVTQCEQMPLVPRVMMGRTLDALRLQWRAAPASARPQLEAACVDGARSTTDMLRSLGCAP